MISGLLIFRHAFLFLALIFAHRAFCALDILPRALGETRRFLPRPTLFFPPKISMAELMLFNCFCSFDASSFNADRNVHLPLRRKNLPRLRPRSKELGSISAVFRNARGIDPQVSKPLFAGGASHPGTY